MSQPTRLQQEVLRNWEVNDGMLFKLTEADYYGGHDSLRPYMPKALRIKAISDAGVSIPEVGELLKIAGSAKVSLNNEAALTAAADKVAVQAKAIASNYDGSELAALDGLLPSADAYKGTVYAP